MSSPKLVGVVLGVGCLAVALAGCGSSPGTSAAVTPSVDVSAAARIVYSNSGDICTMNPDGSGVQNLTGALGSYDDWPTWSPDGTRIAFLRQQGAPVTRNYYVMQADGSQVTQVTHHGAWNSDGFASWSPSGSRLVFAADPDGSGIWHLYLTSTSGTGLKQLTTGGNDSEASWSPDGTTIVFSSSRSGLPQLWLVNPNGTGLKRLTHYNGWDREPRWSQDGTKIAFAREFSGNRDICTMNADGTQVRRLTSNPNLEGSPTWSPDGTRIAFWRWGLGVLVMAADGTGKHLVMAGASAPSWQRKG
jgi:Tol biopolymer transport system component